MTSHDDDTPNPPHVIGRGQPRASLSELMAWYAQTRTIEELLHEIGDLKEPMRTVQPERDR